MADWAGRIKSKQVRPFASFINPHVSEINVLVIDGRKFEHVRGLSKFYIPIEKLHAVLFVSDEKDYSMTYHIFNMDTDQDVAIHARNSVFGYTIGSAIPEDSIQVNADGTLVLYNKDRDAKSTLSSLTNLYCLKSLYYLDPKRNAVTAEKSLFYDEAGKLLLEHDGTPPF